MFKPSSPLSFPERLALVWFLIDGFTHLTMEASYLFFALNGGAIYSDSPLAAIWKEYAKADVRWGVFDPTVVSLEILTVFLAGPACFYLAYAVWKRAPGRHFAQVCLCVAELYGGWMTFAPEWLIGSPALNTSNWVFTWVYLVFMNGLWVVIPAVLLWDSALVITAACEQAKVGLKPAAAPAWTFSLSALLLALYVVIVPAVILTMKA